jgi:hypothetical protein
MASPSSYILVHFVGWAFRRSRQPTRWTASPSSLVARRDIIRHGATRKITFCENEKITILICPLRKTTVSWKKYGEFLIEASFNIIIVFRHRVELRSKIIAFPVTVDSEIELTLANSHDEAYP